LARFGAIAATGESIVRFLKNAFATDYPGTPPVVEQVTTRSFQSVGGVSNNFNTANGSLTLLLYRVDIDTTQRNPISWTRPKRPTLPARQYALPLDLRYLITAWAEQPDEQQLILGRALSALAGHAGFVGSDLVDSYGGVDDIWGPDESFQLMPDEMGTEDLYQIWESVGRPFELSVPFKARVIRLEADLFEGEGTVLERDLAYGKVVPDKPELVP
jgi:hypothetical protein